MRSTAKQPRVYFFTVMPMMSGVGPKYGGLLRSLAAEHGYLIKYSLPEVVPGGLTPPPSRVYPSTVCYMVTVQVNGSSYLGFGPTPMVARQVAEFEAYKKLSSAVTKPASPLLILETESWVASELDDDLILCDDVAGDNAVQNRPSKSLDVTAGSIDGGDSCHKRGLKEEDMRKNSDVTTPAICKEANGPRSMSSHAGCCDTLQHSMSSTAKRVDQNRVQSSLNRVKNESYCEIPQNPNTVPRDIDHMMQVLANAPTDTEGEGAFKFTGTEKKDITDLALQAAREKELNLVFKVSTVGPPYAKQLLVTAVCGDMQFEARHSKKKIARDMASKKLLDALRRREEQQRCQRRPGGNSHDHSPSQSDSSTSGFVSASFPESNSCPQIPVSVRNAMNPPSRVVVANDVVPESEQNPSPVIKSNSRVVDPPTTQPTKTPRTMVRKEGVLGPAFSMTNIRQSSSSECESDGAHSVMSLPISTLRQRAAKRGFSHNPVGQLQELMMKEQQCLPVYAEGVESVGKYTEYICVVSAKGLSAKGVGCSKKLARRHAAENMLAVMEEEGMTIDPSLIDNRFRKMMRPSNSKSKSAVRASPYRQRAFEHQQSPTPSSPSPSLPHQLGLQTPRRQSDIQPPLCQPNLPVLPLQPNPPATPLQPNSQRSPLQPDPPGVPLQQNAQVSPLQPKPPEAPLQMNSQGSPLLPDPPEVPLQQDPQVSTLQPKPPEAPLQSSQQTLQPNPPAKPLQLNGQVPPLQPNPREAPLQPNTKESSQQSNLQESSLQQNPQNIPSQMNQQALPSQQTPPHQSNLQGLLFHQPLPCQLNRQSHSNPQTPLQQSNLQALPRQQTPPHQQNPQTASFQQGKTRHLIPPFSPPFPNTHVRPPAHQRSNRKGKSPKCPPKQHSQWQSRPPMLHRPMGPEPYSFPSFGKPRMPYGPPLPTCNPQLPPPRPLRSLRPFCSQVQGIQHRTFPGALVPISTFPGPGSPPPRMPPNFPRPCPTEFQGSRPEFQGPHWQPLGPPTQPHNGMRSSPQVPNYQGNRQYPSKHQKLPTTSSQPHETRSTTGNQQTCPDTDTTSTVFSPTFAQNRPPITPTDSESESDLETSLQISPGLFEMLAPRSNDHSSSNLRVSGTTTSGLLQDDKIANLPSRDTTSENPVRESVPTSSTVFPTTTTTTSVTSVEISQNVIKDTATGTHNNTADSESKESFSSHPSHGDIPPVHEEQSKVDKLDCALQKCVPVHSSNNNNTAMVKQKDLTLIAPDSGGPKLPLDPAVKHSADDAVTHVVLTPTHLAPAALNISACVVPEGQSVAQVEDGVENSTCSSFVKCATDGEKMPLGVSCIELGKVTSSTEKKSQPSPEQNTPFKSTWVPMTQQVTPHFDQPHSNPLNFSVRLPRERQPWSSAAGVSKAAVQPKSTLPPWVGTSAKPSPNPHPKPQLSLQEHLNPQDMQAHSSTNQTPELPTHPLLLMTQGRSNTVEGIVGQKQVLDDDVNKSSSPTCEIVNMLEKFGIAETLRVVESDVCVVMPTNGSHANLASILK